jgi:multisubunit Na+/H+ antiporter MnhB subunit
MSVSTLIPQATRGPSVRSAGRVRLLGLDRDMLLLWAFVILAALLRFYRLGHQGFWFDEGNTALEVRFTPGEMVTLLKHYESTPPLYYAVAWVWARIFGDTEVGLRSLSAVLGVLAVPVGYAGARKLISRRAGLIAAALIAFNPYLIWYSQEARAYSLVVLLTGASLLALAYARTNPSAWVMTAWTASCALAMATEYYVVLVIVPQAVYLVYVHRRRRSVWISMAALAVWSAPLLWFAVSQNATGHASWIAPIPLAPRVGQIVPQFLVGYGAPALGVLQRVAEAVALIAVVLLFTRSDPRERSGALLAGGVAVGGLILVLLLVAGGIDDLITRNVIVLWMPAAVAVAGGLAAARSRRVGLALTAVLCAIGVTAAGAVAFDRSLQRPDWRKLAHLLGPGPAPGTSERAILLQRYRTLLPLSLYMPRLNFLRQGSATVREFDVVAMQAPRVPLCWWGATCNLSPTTIHSSYPIPGMRVLWRRSVYPFTVERMVPTGGPVTLTAIEARTRFNANYVNAELGTRRNGNGLLIQR